MNDENPLVVYYNGTDYNRAFDALAGAKILQSILFYPKAKLAGAGSMEEATEIMRSTLAWSYAWLLGLEPSRRISVYRPLTDRQYAIDGGRNRCIARQTWAILEWRCCSCGRPKPKYRTCLRCGDSRTSLLQEEHEPWWVRHLNDALCRYGELNECKAVKAWLYSWGHKLFDPLPDGGGLDNMDSLFYSKMVPDEVLIEGRAIVRAFEAHERTAQHRLEETAERIVDAIVRELRGRRGFGPVWDMCHEDTQREIEVAWRRLAMEEINR